MTEHHKSDSVSAMENNEVSNVDELRRSTEATDDALVSSSRGGDVQVFARFRPLNERECSLSEDQSKRVYHNRTEGDNRTIEMLRPPSSAMPTEREFTFDGIFPESTTQEELYQKTARPLVYELLKGFNCTMLAYGQTGAGKSYTMTGNLEDKEREGMIPRMIGELFDEVAARAEQAVFTIQCSFVQLYLEKVSDLLNPELDNLRLREVVSRKLSKSKKLKSVNSFVYIEGCTVYTVKSLKDMLRVMRQGDVNRVTAATDMNDRSSRSHSVFVVNVTQTDVVKQTRRSSKLFLVDLAGSEQISRSGATGLTLEQAKKINKSLSALSLVIQSLVEKKKGAHIPYRDSKLTRLLTDSLGGNAKTVLLLALSPSYDSLVETYSTLSFGARAKTMQNKATVNEELTISTYKKLVSVMGKDLESWKRKYEDSDRQYQALLARCQELEQGKVVVEQEVVRLKETQDVHVEEDLRSEKAEPEMTSVVQVKKMNELEDEGEEVEVEVVTVEDAAAESEGTRRLSGSDTLPSALSPLTLDDLCMFQTGNLVVFGADRMFTFEAF